jgi:hypothetical protein
LEIVNVSAPTVTPTRSLFYRLAAMRDELVIEEMVVRAIQERMDEAFRAAMQRAIDTGEENTPTVVSKKPGTKYPKAVVA